MCCHACNCVKHLNMGILKVVCVWCDSVSDCGLIIWGFNHLSIIECIFSSITAFARGREMGQIGF